MPLSPSNLRAIERLHVRAWPALETAEIDGWLWRRSGGGSNRANSVSTVRFTGDDPEVALDAIEARYRARNAAARVSVYDLSEPAGLTERLKARGYTNNETTVTMVKSAARREMPANVDVSDRPGDDWREVYLGAITENRRVINTERGRSRAKRWPSATIWTILSTGDIPATTTRNRGRGTLWLKQSKPMSATLWTKRSCRSCTTR